MAWHKRCTSIYRQTLYTAKNGKNKRWWYNEGELYIGLIFDLFLWHADLTINRDHLLIQDYLPTKFEASEAKTYMTEIPPTVT